MSCTADVEFFRDDLIPQCAIADGCEESPDAADALVLGRLPENTPVAFDDYMAADDDDYPEPDVASAPVDSPGPADPAPAGADGGADRDVVDGDDGGGGDGGGGGDSNTTVIAVVVVAAVLIAAAVAVALCCFCRKAPAKKGPTHPAPPPLAPGAASWQSSQQNGFAGPPGYAGGPYAAPAGHHPQGYGYSAPQAPGGFTYGGPPQTGGYAPAVYNASGHSYSSGPTGPPPPGYYAPADVNAFQHKPANEIMITNLPAAKGLVVTAASTHTFVSPDAHSVSSTSTPQQILEAQLDAIQHRRRGLLLPLVRCVPCHPPSCVVKEVVVLLRRHTSATQCGAAWLQDEPSARPPCRRARRHRLCAARPRRAPRPRRQILL